jgi:quinohemoprotein amine dehydrogenase
MNWQQIQSPLRMLSMKNMLLKLIISFLISISGVGTISAFDESSLVWKKCTRCHKAENGRIARVEELRTTPEEWTVIVDRMRRLYGMQIRDGEMAVLLKELCATQILTPEEEARISYINLFNNPQVIETPADDEEQHMFTTCVRCHSAAKIYSHRMTGTAWKKLRDFHIYIDPAIMFQMREMYWREEADKALENLARKSPYRRAWTAGQAKPDGQWFMLGSEPGKGSYRGNARLTYVADDEYTLEGKLSFSDGTFETFSGEATLYGGYALRTRTSQNGSATMGAFSFVDGTISGEHHHNAPDYRSSSSTWFPVTDTSRVLRVTPDYLLADEETRILVEGINLPEVTAKDIVVSINDVKVLQASTTSPETIEILLAYQGKGHKNFKLGIKGLEDTAAKLVLKLAPKIDYLSVNPALGRARVNGGINYPAEGVQFQALAYSNGEDADNPADDILLGPVAADFHLAEEKTRPNDDDLVHLGAIKANGTYLPSGDFDPIPAREYGGEATGMVKVIAKYTRGEATYSAEGKLVVTVPDYIQRLK